MFTGDVSVVSLSRSKTDDSTRGRGLIMASVNNTFAEDSWTTFLERNAADAKAEVDEAIALAERVNKRGERRHPILQVCVKSGDSLAAGYVPARVCRSFP